MREADKACGIFLHTVLVPLHNSSALGELKPTVWQEASIKMSDTEIAQLAITVRPQRCLFNVKFWNQWATLKEMEGEPLWKIHVSTKRIGHSVTTHWTAETHLVVLVHVGWAENAPTGLQLLLFYCFFPFLFASNFSPPLCFSCLTVWSRVKWMKCATGRVHPAHGHILGEGQRGRGRRRRRCL